jgi:hypothetical protein
MADDPVNVAGRAGKNKRNFFGGSNTARAMAGDPAELHPSGPAWSPRHNRWVGASARYGVTGGKARARCEGARRPDRVVGPDQGPTPPDLSSRSLLQRRREREPGIRQIFFVSRAVQRRSFTAGYESVYFLVHSACNCL